MLLGKERHGVPYGLDGRSRARGLEKASIVPPDRRAVQRSHRQPEGRQKPIDVRHRPSGHDGESATGAFSKFSQQRAKLWIGHRFRRRGCNLRTSVPS